MTFSIASSATRTAQCCHPLAGIEVFHTSIQFYCIRTAQASRRARSPDLRRNVESISAVITVMQTPFMASLCDSAACDLIAGVRCGVRRSVHV